MPKERRETPTKTFRARGGLCVLKAVAKVLTEAREARSRAQNCRVTGQGCGTGGVLETWGGRVSWVNV